MKAKSLDRTGGRVLKSELIRIVAARNPHLFLRDVEIVADTIFDELLQALCRGDRVELRGFGSFFAKSRNARKGRNPKTGDPVDVREKTVPGFKCSRQLHHRLNADERRHEASSLSRADRKT